MSFCLYNKKNITRRLEGMNLFSRGKIHIFAPLCNRSWFIGNRLMINDAKTDFLIIGTRQQLEKTSIESIIIGDTVIKPLESVRNLGSWFDAHMRMNVHIGKICSKAFRGLYNIRQIRKFLTVQSTKTLIHAFVSSHLDYCNALLFGLPRYPGGGLRIWKGWGCSLEILN